MDSTRRQFMTYTAGTLAGYGLGKGAPRQAPPNIVFLMADDLGYADLSCYGRRDFATPHVDGLARGGVRFTQFYANSPVCSASRTALMTGRYHYRLRAGLEEPITSTDTTNGLPPDHPTLPSLLRGAGYRTALVGKWHLGLPPKFGPRQSGYDQFWGVRGPGADYFQHSGALWDNDTRISKTGYLTDLLGDQAVSVIRQQTGKRTPFLLSLHFTAPHWPWEGPGDEPESRRLKNPMHWDGGSQDTYRQMVQRMDYQVGRVLQALEEGGLAENTMVIFTSDNGGERYSDTWPFTGKKTELLEGGLRIPAIVRWPGRIRAGSTTEQVGITMDWLPTLLACAGVKPAASHPPDGMDLSAHLDGRQPPAATERTLYWRYRRNGQRAMRDGHMKWLKMGPNTFLFDVAADPQERANLKDRRPDVYRKMEHAWQEWNATMLPEDPAAYSHGFSGSQLADHYSPTEE